MGNNLQTKPLKPANKILKISEAIRLDSSGSLTFDDQTECIYLLDHTTHEISLITNERQQVIVSSRYDHFPWCIKCINNLLYVTDTFQHCVDVFDKRGGHLFTRFLRTVNNPREIELDGRGLLYLCDNGNSRVLVLTPELYVVSIFKVDYPSDVIVLPDEVMVYSSERQAVTVISEGRIQPQHYTIDSRIKGFGHMHKCGRDVKGNLILFNSNSAQLLFVDEITFTLVKRMSYTDIRCLNYMELHPDQNRMAILYKQANEGMRDSVHLTYIPLSS